MYELDAGHEGAAHDDAHRTIAPGKRNLSATIQRKVRDAAAMPTAPVARGPSRAVADDPFALHLAASRGVEGGATAVPHLDRIQASFEGHDVSHVQAHQGAAATQACESIGARAYATGDHVAFDGAPDLHTAAHEAAHVVQQRAGVHLAGGVGAAGDRYEAHADAVADRVVRGEPAGALLDELAGGAPRDGASGAAVQRKVKGFPYVEVKTAPDDVINAVTADNSFPRGLSERQLELLRDIINEKDESSIPQVRVRLQLAEPRDHDDHDPFDFDAPRRDDRRGTKDKKEKKQPTKRLTLELSEQAIESSNDDGDVAGFLEQLRHMPTSMLAELLTEPETLAFIASTYSVGASLARNLLEKTLRTSLRPLHELALEVGCMPLAEVVGIERGLFGKGTEDVKFFLSEFDLTGNLDEVFHAIHLQQTFYQRYQHVDPIIAAELLSNAPRLLEEVCELHPDGKRVFPHVLALLRQLIGSSLSKAQHGQDLPKDATFLLSWSQPIDDGRILRPARIIKPTQAFTFGRIQMFCSIDGASPACTGRELERLLDGKSLEEHIRGLMGDEETAPTLPKNASIKCASTMKVPGFGSFVRVICKHGLCWVPEDCVEERVFSYDEPDRKDGEGKVALFGEGGIPLVEHVEQGGLGNCYLMAGLMSVVALDPKHICNMMHELDDQTVAVRFFMKDRSTNQRVPRWIRVNRKVVMIDGQAIFAKVGGALWPAMIEKAFGECGGGLEATGEGGQTSGVFSMLLGHEGVSIEITNPSRTMTEDGGQLHALPVHPLFMTAEQFAHLFQVKRELAEAFVKAAAELRTVLEKDIGKIEDRKEVAKAVEQAAKLAKLAPPVVKNLLRFVDMHIPSCGITGGTYSTRAQMMHGSILAALQHGRVVALGSKRWDSERRGPSGEPLSDIGLAGSHAYAVLQAYHRGEQLMLVIRNPWGHMGMKYDRSNKLITSLGNFLSIPMLERVSIDDAEFEIDIEDVIRFFGNIYLG